MVWGSSMLIVPTAMPDEFVLGFWGRIHALNCLTTPSQTIEALIDYLSVEPSDIARVQALALAANMDFQAFTQNHTLIPVHGAISQHFAGETHGSLSRSKSIRCTWKLLQKKEAQFCSACAAEQRAQWGYSYWKRNHQLLGVDWCPEHGIMLLSSVDTAFLTDAPCRCVSSTARSEIDREKSYWPVLERYASIMNAYLAKTTRTAIHEVANLLRPLAAAKGLSTRNSKTANYLSDIAVEILPGWWLESVFPSLNTKLPHRPFPALDNTVMSGYAMPPAYALAMALLCESTEEALAFSLFR